MRGFLFPEDQRRLKQFEEIPSFLLVFMLAFQWAVDTRPKKPANLAVLHGTDRSCNPDSKTG
jgi:hypothetical protein